MDDPRAPAAGDRRLPRIVVVGGGTAGWVAASILARALTGAACTVVLVESDEIGTVGVGEATIPPFVDLLRFLSIDEADFVRHTQATYKLGIRFDDWGEVGERYWHPFGTTGAPIARRPFFHAWHRLRALGHAPRLEDYSVCAALGELGRFRFADPAEPGAAGLRYALHVDAALVARYLSRYAQALGVARVEGRIAGVTRREDGALDELVLADGRRVQGDLYLDCSGFRGLLIEQELRAGYVDWSELLPCDRAIAAPTLDPGPRPPFTQAAARPAGWRWRIPLQHRTGNGYVHASAFVGEQAAIDDLMGEVKGTPQADPRVLRFTAGRRRAFWSRNCVAIGLASGFLEPLESTSIHLAVSSVLNLLEHFPDRDFDPRLAADYNAGMGEEVERIRDFIVLHYVLTRRRDTPFWRHVGAITPPDSLAARVEAYRATGRARPRPGELFTDLSWFYIFEGLGVRPRTYDPLVEVVAPDALAAMAAELARETARAVARAAPHDEMFDARPAA